VSISAWWLVFIIPVCFCLGIVAGAAWNTPLDEDMRELELYTLTESKRGPPQYQPEDE
jgi:hypothetical protein